MAGKVTLSRKFARSGAVDRAAGIIYGVAVITQGAVRGWGVSADATTLEQVKACSEAYEGGLKVKADHKSGIFGTAASLRKFRIDGDTLRADLHVLKSEVNREKLFEMAEEISDTFGLSIVFSGEDEVRGGKRFARCTEIYSADIVSEPAANPNGLFSQPETTTMTPEEIKAAIDAMRADLAAIVTRCSALETGFAGCAPKAEMSAIDTGLKELSAKIADRNELASVIAKQFAERLGVAPAAAPAAAPAIAAAPPAAPVKNFEAVVKEQRDLGKGRGEAVTFCVKAHADLYQDYRNRQATGQAGQL
jgi:hypothetical protein